MNAGEGGVENQSRVKKAELLSEIGAVVLGIGLGVLFSNFLELYAVPILLAGLAAHALGLFMKHEFERASIEAAPARLWWAEVLYWVCWVALLGVGVYAAIDYLSGN
jgi:hypothetical protein